MWVYIFYFIMCAFMGWLLETGYELYKVKTFTNRGFLKGPIVPVYGFCAVFIIFYHQHLYIDVDYMWLGLIINVFVIATIISAIEYVTGKVLMKIFSRRWWDYSDQPLNLDGHICLGFSITWGVLSYAFMVYIMPSLEATVMSIPIEIIQVLDITFILYVTVDFMDSVKTYLYELNLKEVKQILPASIGCVKNDVSKLIEWMKI